MVSVQRLRIHHRRAAGGRDPDLAGLVEQGRRTRAAVALRAGEAVGFAEMVRGQRLRAAGEHRVDVAAAHAHHAAVGGQPQAADAVVDDREQGIDRQALRQPERLQPAVAVAQQAAIAGHPDRAVGVFMEIEDVLRVANLARVDPLHVLADDARRPFAVPTHRLPSRARCNAMMNSRGNPSLAPKKR